MAKNLTKAASSFAADETLEKLFQTSDGFCFRNEADAVAHSKSLNDNDVYAIERSEVKSENPADRPLSELKLDELKKVAESLSIDASKLKSKAEVIALIEAKNAETVKAEAGQVASETLSN